MMFLLTQFNTENLANLETVEGADITVQELQPFVHADAH